MNMDKVLAVVTPDANSLQLESGGKIDLPHDGRPFSRRNPSCRWIPLVTPLDVLTNMPAGPAHRQRLVGTPGVACDAQWARQHAETVLRFTSVMFRIIEQEQKNPDLMLNLCSIT